MTEYANPVDIANRALYHTGSNPIADFTDLTQEAVVMADLYDKVRVAEMRHNAWRFSIRRAVIRPMGVNTRIMQPTLWSSVTTYEEGQIASDIAGNLWLSLIAGNLNNDPSTTAYWSSYFGPLSVDPFDSTQTYSSTCSRR